MRTFTIQKKIVPDQDRKPLSNTEYVLWIRFYSVKLRQIFKRDTKLKMKI